MKSIYDTFNAFMDRGIINAFILVKTWWNRGITYIAIFLTLFNILSLSLLWRPILVEYGIPPWTFYIFVPTLTVILAVMIGYYDTSRKLWLRESDVINKNANPYDAPFNKMFTEVAEIHEALVKQSWMMNKLKLIAWLDEQEREGDQLSGKQMRLILLNKINAGHFNYV